MTSGYSIIPSRPECMERFAVYGSLYLPRLLNDRSFINEVINISRSLN